METALGREIKQHWISNFLKNELGYSYKRGSDRNTRASSSTSIYKQAIFWCKLIAKLHAECLVINIDESSFGRSVKQNYAWLPKNHSSGIVNVGALGRTTLIFALMSTGSWMGLLVNETVTGQGFNLFLYLLMIYIDSTFKDLISKAIVTIDNASIHLTTDNKKTAANCKFEMLGLPPYLPHLALVEYVFCHDKGLHKKQEFQ